MKLSKSILNPIRATRNGGQGSSTGKKRGGAFENHEPSSPKVTCIGQVRVKSKKRAKQCGKRRTGEVSFRKTEQNPQERLRQRWVHLPTSVCEALRAFGAEFSCCLLFPCKISSCEKKNKYNDEIKSGCCNYKNINANEGGRAATERMCVRSSRRHVFDDIEVKNGRIEVKGRRSMSMEVEEEEEERARVSICIPPKNALLLMRCRSDPPRCNWEEEITSVDFEGKENICEDDEAFDLLEIYQEKFVNSGEEKEEIFESSFDQEEDCQVEKSPANCHLSLSAQSPTERNDAVEEKEEELTEEESEHEKEEQNQTNQELENSNQLETKKAEEITVLPESLLLMMCEPKLSMEVSKETWVRSTDFIRWLPRKPAGCDHHQLKRRPSIDSKANPSIPAPPAKKNERHDQLQPARSSCSLPAASMATMIEQKLGAYEPSALTRCKSEPMRTAAAKLMPESCFWKNGSMKVEPHGRVLSWADQ